MLFLIFQKIDPSTAVGLAAVLKKIKTTTLGDHTNGVDGMLKSIEATYKILGKNGNAPSNYCHLLLNALATGPNNLFNLFIQCIKGNVESGIGAYAAITVKSLIIDA